MRSPFEALPHPVAPLFGCILLLLPPGCADPEAIRPNVVLVVVDSLRADHLDHLGYERPTASPLDAFRDEAVLFSDASAPAPWTLPSTASLLTGYFPIRHALLRADDGLGLGVVTLAEHLQSHGYATAALVHHPQLTRARGFARGFDRFEGTLGEATDTSDAGEMLAWLRSWLADPPEEPFFLYLHAMNPHGPYRVPEDQRGILLGRAPSSKLTYRKAVFRGLAARPSRVPPKEVEAVVEQYDTALRYTLDRVAELLRMLERNGVYRDTLVVITGDHGEELFDHGRIGHGRSLYREVLHVPLYVRPPGGTEGRTVDGAVSLLDVVPTVLELLGLPPLRGDGRSLAPLVDGRATLAPKHMTFHHTLLGSPFSSRAVVDGRYKLVESHHEQLLVSRQLYDLGLDPGENEDRSAQGPEITERLSLSLREAFQDFAKPLPAESAGSEGL